MPTWLIWLVAAGVLGAAEVVSGDLILIMLAGGAVAGAGAAELTGSFVIQVLVAAVVSVALLLGVRPVARRRLLAGDGGVFGVDRLTGKEAVVLRPVDGSGGRIRLEGQEWSARSFDPADIHHVGETVKIMHIDGATAVVWHGP